MPVQLNQNANPKNAAPPNVRSSRLITAAIEAVGGYLMLQRRATGWWLLALGLVVSLLTNLVHASVITFSAGGEHSIGDVDRE